MKTWKAHYICLVVVICLIFGYARTEVIISESNMRTGLDKDQVFFECNTQYCENNKKIRYFWVYDEIFKFHRKYKHLGKLSFYSKMSIITGAFRRIFNEKAILGFYVIKQLKDREILEIGPFQSDQIPSPFIEYGEGTIGRSWKEKTPLVIQDVTLSSEYLELHSLTKAELTYPIIDPISKKVLAIFTINSRFENHFEKMDEIGVSRIMEWMHKL